MRHGAKLRKEAGYDPWRIQEIKVPVEALPKPYGKLGKKKGYRRKNLRIGQGYIELTFRK